MLAAQGQAMRRPGIGKTHLANWVVAGGAAVPSPPSPETAVAPPIPRSALQAWDGHRPAWSPIRSTACEKKRHNEN